MLPHPNIISEAIPPHQEKYLRGSTVREFSLVTLHKGTAGFSVEIMLKAGS